MLKKMKHLALRKFLSNHYCLNEINNSHLLLSKRLFKELVEIGPSLNEMRLCNRFNDKFWSRETEKFRKSLIYDQTYLKILRYMAANIAYK